MSKKKGLKYVTELLPITGYDDRNNCFKTKNGYLDILQIRCKDIYATHEDALEYDIFTFARLLKVYSGDLKIVCMNFPTDTSFQQQYIIHKYQNTRNPVFKAALKEKLAELVALPTYRTDKEYYVFIFAKTADEQRTAVNTVSGMLSQADMFQYISEDKKIRIISKIMNMNTAVV